jgi:hypothetical protein
MNYDNIVVKRRRVISPSNATFSQEASGDSAAWTNYLARTTSLGAPYAAAIQTMLNGMTADGLFESDGTSNYFDALYVFANQDATNAVLNLVSSSFAVTPVDAGPLTFTAGEGYSGLTAADDYLDTGFNASTASGKVTQNSRHHSVFDITASGSVEGQAIGLRGSATNGGHIHTRYTDGSTYFRVGNNAEAGVSNATIKGHYIANRSTSSAVQGYRNGSSIYSNGSSTSAALDNFNFGFPGSATGTQPTGVAAGSFGASLDATKAGQLYSRLYTCLNTINSTLFP